MHENFFHKLKVYYEDTDSGGVVYYANYLKYLERARTEALFSIGFSNKKVHEQFGSLIIVKSCNIEYKKSAKFEDEIEVVSKISEVKISSFKMLQVIKKKSEIISVAEVVLVTVNKKGKPVRIPSFLKKLID